MSRLNPVRPAKDGSLLGTTLADDRQRHWKVETALGRGLWASTWLVRDPDGRDLVLRLALGEADFAPDLPIPPGLLAACSQAVREQVELLRAAPPHLPKLEGTVALPDGRPGLLVPRHPSTLAREILRGSTLGRILAIVVRVAERLGEADRPHGNLRPSNILLNERGEPVLADPLPDSLRTHRLRLMELAAGRRDYLPPESAQFPSFGWDTYALCAIAWEAVLLGPDDPAPVLPRRGIDKLGLAKLKDAALSRLKEEGANARFVNRVADRLGSLLNRGLSLEHHPSPPYRFEGAADLLPRLTEVAGLVQPKVESVGRLLLGANAKGGVYNGVDEVGFSVTIGCTTGVVNHEHVACGVQVRDLDATTDTARDGGGRVPVPDARFTVHPHNTGRLRFDFVLPSLAPGRYRARVAFSIKDSGQEPLLAESDFEVRPPPGYVPPSEPVSTPRPVDLAEARRARTPTPPTPLDREIRADAEVLPMPVAPSSPGVEVMVDFEPSLDDAGLAEAADALPGHRTGDTVTPLGFGEPRATSSAGAHFAEPEGPVTEPSAGGDPVPVALPDATGPRPVIQMPTPSVRVAPAAPPVRAATPTPAAPARIATPVVPQRVATPAPAVRAAAPSIAPARPSITPTPSFTVAAEPRPTEAPEDDWLPGAGAEDLPGWDERPERAPNPIVDVASQIFDVIRRDPVTAILVLIAAFLMSALVLLVVIQALLF